MYINGQWVNAVSGATFSTHNPSNGEKIGEVADGNQDDARQAIESAHGAFETWSGLTAYQRSEYLYRAYQFMMEQKEYLARVMTEEQGKPLKASMGEVRYGADFLLWYAEEAKRIYGETIPAPRSDQRFIVLRHPAGV
ncbi:MAG: aldehyde dehydrogenase family protein, partial [Deltaproteobacteria bacterium]|nr:aldehyde dehydrogenase family protein [Deltaproteobacteria bacterium]